MMTFVRTIIEFPAEMLDRLDAISTAKRQPRAVTVREAVGEYLERNVKEGTANAFGLWNGRKQDGVEFQDALRNEWT